MLHREAESVGRGIHPVRHIYNKYCVLSETTIIVWDGKYGNKRRKDLFPDYKGNRKPREESTHEMFDLAKAVLRFTPTILIECPTWEADDVIGTLSKKLYKTNKITIETNDGDFWQLQHMAKLPMIAAKWHPFSPGMLILYKSIVGDGKDNIPGVRGVGPKIFNSMSKADCVKILKAIENKDYNAFREAVDPTWPKRISRDFQTFDNICLYHKLNKFMTVPDKDIDEGTTRGKLNIVAAEHFMRNYLI